MALGLHLHRTKVRRLRPPRSERLLAQVEGGVDGARERRERRVGGLDALGEDGGLAGASAGCVCFSDHHKPNPP